MRTAHAEYITKTHSLNIYLPGENKTISNNKMCPTCSLIRGLPGKLNLPCTYPINIKQALGPNLYRPCEQKCKHSDS